MSVADDTILQLKDMIASGQVGPGDKLPREADLASRLGVSRNALREAVRALELVGILSARQGDGTYVTSLEPDLPLKALGLVMELLTEETIVEMCELRRLLEPAVAAMATARITDDALEQLRHCLRRMDDRGADRGELAKADLEFHRVIARAGGNRSLAAVLDNISTGQIRASMWHGLAEEGNIARAQEEHRAIYRAIVDRNPGLAQALVAAHVVKTESWLRARLATSS